MFSLKFFICLSALYVTANAAVVLMYSDDKPAKFANLEGCYMKIFDRVLSYGEAYKPTGGSCARYSCSSDNLIQVATCGSVGVPDGCEPAAGDKSLPYPKCCGGVKCKKSDGTYEYLFP